MILFSFCLHYFIKSFNRLPYPPPLPSPLHKQCLLPLLPLSKDILSWSNTSAPCILHRVNLWLQIARTRKKGYKKRSLSPIEIRRDEWIENSNRFRPLYELRCSTEMESRCVWKQQLQDQCIKDDEEDELGEWENVGKGDEEENAWFLIPGTLTPVLILLDKGCWGVCVWKDEHIDFKWGTGVLRNWKGKKQNQVSWKRVGVGRGESRALPKSLNHRGQCPRFRSSKSKGEKKDLSLSPNKVRDWIDLGKKFE